MNAPLSRGAAAIFLFSVSAGASQAEITAQDVWSDWRAYLLGTGYEVSGSESLSGNTLTVADTALTIRIPDEDVTFEVRIGDLSFTENGDGTVSVSFPQTMPLVISGEEDGETFEAVVNYNQTGFSMVASGEPADMIYNYTASSMALTLDSVTVDGEVAPPDLAQFNLSIDNVIGTSRMQGTDLRTYAQKAQAGQVSFDLNVRDRDSNDSLEWSGGSNGLEFDATSSLPGEMDTQNMAAMIEKGFAGSGTFSFGPGSSKMAFQDPSESFDYESSSQGGSFSVNLGLDGLGYDFRQNAVAMSVAGTEIPLPIAINISEFVFGLAMPVMQSDDAQDFSLDLALGDFTMSDLIWGIFDPTGQLPRDPATIAVSLAGKAKLLADVLDPMVAADLEDGPPPAELESLTISGLEVSAAGASLTGTGDFTFDNSDTETFDGMPRPTGAVDLRLVGANGLLDKLVGMGLLPEEDAGAARMMMGLFAVPGDGADTLNSKLEINEQGHILANGQRIQ